MSKIEHDTANKSVHHNEDSKTILGFWVYLMTDCVLFASLFATYAVLHNNTYGGPTATDIFDLNYVLIETLILLTSSFTIGLAMWSLHRKNKTAVLSWLLITFLLGLAFLGMEIYEFHELIQEGSSWTVSAFLSSYFTLVGTHGLHITIGLLWMFVLASNVIKRGITNTNIKRLTLLSLFWHFLDIIWIFIFTVVYLLGVAGQ